MTVPNFLAERLGQHQSFIARFESGQHRIDVVELLETYLKIPDCCRSAINKEVIRLTDEQWKRIRKHFPEEHIPDGRAGRSQS